MYRVLVVDDEPYVRKGIIHAIKWKNHGLELVGEAEDGIEALDLIHQLKPDILITDMRMPDMDGIGLIKEINVKMPGIKVIVISAYSDFEYTREAIKNNVFDYVLKPIKKDELNNVLFNCINDIDKMTSDVSGSTMKEKTEVLVEKYVLNLSAETEKGSENYETVKNFLKFPDICCCVCKIDQIHEVEKTNSGDKVFELLKESIEKRMDVLQGQYIVFLNRPYKEVIMVISIVRGHKTELKSNLKGICGFIKRNCGFSVSIGIGEQAENPYALYTSYNQAIKVLKMKNLAALEVVADFSDVKSDRTTETIYSSYHENRLLGSIKTGDEKTARKYFDCLLNEFASSEMTAYIMQKNMVILLGSIEKMLNGSGTSMDKECEKSSIAYVDEIMGTFSLDEVREIFYGMIAMLSGSYNLKNKKGGKKVIDEVIKNVENNYFKPVSIYDYAKQYFLNPDYLGRIFKNATGKNFNDFLAETRINKAKSILSNNEYKHYYEVANSVGYDDYSYFCKVFKMFTGMTPGEYKEDCLKNKVGLFNTNR